MSIESIWHAITHGVHEVLVKIFGQAAMDKVDADVKKVLSDGIRPIFIDAIEAVSSLSAPGTEKRVKAFEKITTDLVAAGHNLETSVINMGIELVVNLLKAKGQAGI